MRIELKCMNCNNSFEAEFKHRDKKFCNRKCYFEYSNKFNIVGRKKDQLLREVRKCVVCNKEFEVKKKAEKKMCSNECRQKWDSISEHRDKRIEAGRKVLLENHGVDSIFKKEGFKEQLKNIMLDKYGVSHPMEYPLFVDKIKNTFRCNHLERLLPKLIDAEIELLDEYSVNKNGNTSLPYNFKCLKCDNIFTSTIMGTGKIPICRKCFPLIKNSKLEETIRDFLCNRVLDKLELLERYFNRKPCVGVDTHVKRDYLYYKSIQDKFNEEFEVVS